MGISSTVSTFLINQLLIILSSKITKFRFVMFLSSAPTSSVSSFTCLEVPYHLSLYQTRPTYHPEGLFDENKVSEKPKERTNPIIQLWHANGRCPENTIPIRRTKEDDVLRASSAKRYGKKRHRTIPQPRSADPDLINQSGHQVILLPFKYNQSFILFNFFYFSSDIVVFPSELLSTQ